MKKARIEMKTVKFPLLLAGIVLICTLAIGTAAASTPPCCDCGCASGFWKNHLDEWTMGAPDIPIGSDLNGDGEADTWLDALNYKGGSGIECAQRILYRAYVAAFLNTWAFKENYPGSDQNVYEQMIATYSSGDREAMIALAEQLDAWNNGVCAL